MTRRLVVLPQPEGPSSVRNSPRATSRSTASRPTMPPAKILETVSSLTSGSGAITDLRRLGGIHPKDLAALAARIAECVGERALEGETVAGLEHIFGGVD